MNAHRQSLKSLSELAPAPVVVPSLSALDTLALPDLSDRYSTHAGHDGPRPLEKEGILDKTDKLDRLLDTALNKLEELLEVSVDVSDPDNARIIAAQLTASQTVISTVLKADDTRLRARQTDMLPKLLEIMRSEESKMVTIEG